MKPGRLWRLRAEIRSFAAVIILAPMISHAAVLDSSASGFTVSTTLEIAAQPDAVYQRIVHNVGDWWNPQHTFSGNSHNLPINKKIGWWAAPVDGVIREQFTRLKNYIEHGDASK